MPSATATIVVSSCASSCCAEKARDRGQPYWTKGVVLQHARLSSAQPAPTRLGPILPTFYCLTRASRVSARASRVDLRRVFFTPSSAGVCARRSLRWIAR